MSSPRTSSHDFHGIPAAFVSTAGFVASAAVHAAILGASEALLSSRAVKQLTGSKTVTETKRKRKGDMTGFGGVTCTTTRRSWATNDKGIMRVVKKQPTLQSNRDANGLLHVNYGECDYFPIWQAIEKDDVDAMFTAAKTLAYQNTGSPLFNAAADNFCKIFIKDFYQEVEFFNGGNTPVYMDIYEARPTKDWIKVGDDGPNTPVQLIKAGTNSIVENASPVPAYNQISHKPYQSVAFCERFHVWKHHFILLAPGQRHIHKVHLQFNWSINQDYYDNYNGTQPLVLPKHKSHIVFVRLRGSVVTNNPSTEATTSKVTVAYVRQWKYKWSYVVNMFPEQLMTTSLDTSPANPQTVTAAGSAVAAAAVVP